MNMVRRTGEVAPAVAAYKTVLRDVLDRRPSGMRKRLAEALGKNRSFVSQVANPAYPTPLPAVHVEAVMEICHFSPAERKAFVAAYAAAHPRRAPRLDGGRDHARQRTMSVRLPDLGDERRNRELDRLVHELVARIVRIVEPGDDDVRSAQETRETVPRQPRGKRP